jgi:hypothetical protein
MEALYTGADSFANSALLGLPKRLGLTGAQTPEQEAMMARHPIAAGIGEVGGMLAGGNPANLLAGGVGGAVKAAAPRLAESFLGRTALAAGQGVIAGGVGAGTRTAAEGGSLGDSLSAGGTGAAVGGALGGGVSATLGEAARGVRGLVRSRYPDIGQAEAGGAQMSPLRGAVSGPEMGAIQSEAKAAGSSPVDYQASKLVEPLTATGNAELKAAAQQVAREVEQYTSSPEGQKLRPMDKLLGSYTQLYQNNIASESGAPLAEAEIGGLKKSINNLADVKLVPPSRSDALMSQPGTMRLSMDEATRRGFDVDAAARSQLQNPEMARFMDVVVTPRRYNAQEILQNIKNLEGQVKESPRDQILRQRLAAAMEQRDAFPGLSELRKGHEELLGGVENELGLAQVPTKGAFSSPNDEKALFNNVSGYGNAGRYPAVDEALRSQAGKAGVGGQLDMVKALRALQSLQGGAPSVGVGITGRPHLSLPGRAVGTRLDPIMQLLMQVPQPIGTVGGQVTGRRRPIDEFDF